MLIYRIKAKIFKFPEEQNLIMKFLKVIADQSFTPYIFHYNVNMEILTYASDYIDCVDKIYEEKIKVESDAYNITGK